ncbi:hypothetical protein NQ314_001888 [Rhamnusium bicolor]|uniref:Uncharacterized protein n=1 Tax=Rhamnusium bicolor TaxID=1586634 RepID=A0AAV8ZQQ2_9CUCU|nr:hypothetical protein NQ314_001888 [Rhamnusium bicolor]
MNRLSAPVMLFAHDMFFESDSNDDHEESGEEKKYFVEQIKCMNTKQFKRHFRMNVQTFEHLLVKLYGIYQSKVGHPEISLEEGCLICIWYLANLESFR